MWRALFVLPRHSVNKCGLKSMPRSRRSREHLPCSGVTSTKLQVSVFRRAVLPACLLAATATGLACQAGAAQSQPNQSGSAQFPAPAALQLHVSGNRLVNANGARVVLHGVDYSGTEYECVQGKGIFAGPNDQASVLAMESWDINAVRLPLNEACWNGESYVNPAYAGANYRSAIETLCRAPEHQRHGRDPRPALDRRHGTGAATDCARPRRSARS